MVIDSGKEGAPVTILHNGFIKGIQGSEMHNESGCKFF